MGHSHPQTPVHIDNTTCVGIVNNTIKRQRSRAMEMQYFWLLDQKPQRYIKVYYQPGAENMGNYPQAEHTQAISTNTACFFVSSGLEALLLVDHVAFERRC